MNFFLLVVTLERLGEFSTVIRTLDFVSGLHDCFDSSQPLTETFAQIITVYSSPCNSCN